MIGWGDIYKVVTAMVPLYVALGLGYGSVRWWRIFTPEQCDAINSLVAFFTLPFFTFQFTLTVDPFAMNYRFLAADAISKLIIVLALAAWAKCSSKGSYCWTITSFSLSTLTNSLVVGVPLLNAMYGRLSQDLVVQLSVVQAIVWLTLLLFVLEVRKAGSEASAVTAATSSASNHQVVVAIDSSSINTSGVTKNLSSSAEEVIKPTTDRPSFWLLMKIVWLKLALNPNSYASILGISWAFIANR